jgi:N-acetylmuramoyl-L-alanine amidase
VVVVIDPGHGGRDPGAVGIGGLQEKQVIFPMSLRVAELLEQQGVVVVMTRRDDITLDLQARVDIANRSGGNIFVSIHANAISMSRPEVNGVETYFSSERGRRLAATIQSNMLAATGMRDRGVKQARFYVIRHTNMPAALVEVGFVTGAEDAPRLADPAWRETAAQAIARGILQYIQQGL